MNKPLSKKILSLSPSITLEITAKAKEMKKNGVDIISFGVGEPDFNTPENIQIAAINAIKNGLTKYTATSGVPELKSVICNKLLLDNNLKYSNDNIIVSSGAKHSIYNALLAILNVDDEVLIAAPYWVSYPEMIKLADGKPVIINTSEENGFKFSVADLEKHKTNKTKAIIINSPSNPTGSIYTKEELEKIAEWCVNNDVYVISDEIYEKLIYGDKSHISIASINEEIKKLTIVVNGVSKAYAMTGWRIGYIAADKSIVSLINNIQGHSTSNPCTISQYASIEALTGPQDALIEMKKHFEERRNYMVSTINSIDGLSCKCPDGAFYIMINIKKLMGKTIKSNIINSSLDFSNILLDTEKIAVIPGIAFGDDDYIRVSYATSMENIKIGLSRIANLLK